MTSRVQSFIDKFSEFDPGVRDVLRSIVVEMIDQAEAEGVDRDSSAVGLIGLAVARRHWRPLDRGTRCRINAAITWKFDADWCGMSGPMRRLTVLAHMLGYIEARERTAEAKARRRVRPARSSKLNAYLVAAV